MSDLRILAGELRRIRLAPPATIGEALPAYAEALRNARARGVDTATLLLVGELLWTSIRPEFDPTPDAIGDQLDVYWEKFLADLAFCADPSGGKDHG